MYTAEMFPTEIRHSLLGICSMFGRIGSMVAPQTPLLVRANKSCDPFIFFFFFLLYSKDYIFNQIVISDRLTIVNLQYFQNRIHIPYIVNTSPYQLVMETLLIRPLDYYRMSEKPKSVFVYSCNFVRGYDK